MSAYSSLVPLTEYINLHRKRARRDRHRPYQRRSNALPESPYTFSFPGLREAVPHALEPLLRAETITLHLALDDVEWITPNPEHLAGKATIECNLRARYFFSRDVVAFHVCIHEVLERQEPTPVGLRFTEDSDDGATVEASEHPFMHTEFLDAV